MKSNTTISTGEGTYYVRGSGWVPISAGRLREIHCAIRDFHERESEEALVLMRHRTMV